MFDLSDLTLPAPSAKRRHDWLCLNCRVITISCGSCRACNSKEFIPHLDRRPLLLSKEVRNGIIDLIDQAAAKVPELEIEDQMHFTGEYMPFLSRLLDEAELADKRMNGEGSGFRVTDMPVSEMLEVFSKMQLPPTTAV